jgi:hypothetical protein
VRKQVGGDPELLAKNPGNVLEFVRIAFLSDTVVIGVARKASLAPHIADVPNIGAACTVILAGMLGEILRQAVSQEPRFIYRGCIASGEFDMNQNFVIGPAVDDAVESMDAAQGAFVWTLPSTNLLLASFRGPIAGLVEFDVPIKGGDTFRTRVVSPFDPNLQPKDRNPQGRERIAQAILNEFDRTSLGIEVKRQNTQRFLEACLQAEVAIDSVVQAAVRNTPQDQDLQSSASKSGGPSESAD